MEQSIGTKDLTRQRGLIVEQTLLIRELRLLQDHLEQLAGAIGQIIEQSREGQILTSIPPIGPLSAAAILATLGSIGNFEDAAHLKSYFGWAPVRAQTGVSFDRTHLTPAGSREMKKVMFLVAWKAVQTDTEWAKLYERLVPRLSKIAMQPPTRAVKALLTPGSTWMQQWQRGWMGSRWAMN